MIAATLINKLAVSKSQFIQQESVQFRQMIELALQITDNSDTPLHEQIYEQIRAAVLTGRVKLNQRIPASRQLAKSLSVSRTTVIQSYDQLISEGYLETRLGAGTFVCAQIPDELLKTTKALSVEQPLSDQSRSDTPWQLSDLALSKYGDRLQHTPDRLFTEDSPLSFRYGLPALAHFPIQTWRRIRNHCGTASTEWMDYSAEPMGYEPLRMEIAQYVTQARAVRCTPGQILITNGTQQALSLIVRLLSTQVIAIENPGYLSARRVFESSGAAVLPVPVDAEGIKVDGPEGLLSRCRSLSFGKLPQLVYVTPSHQFPTGVLMSLSRRLALLQWAQQANALIIEDDYDSEFRYSGRPVSALQGLDTHDRVLYVGTFSKIMVPGLRLGYVVLPPALIPLFRRAKWLCDRQGSIIDQQALSIFIRDGHLAKHVRRMRGIYETRRRSLVTGLSTLSSHTNQPISILGDEAGLHVTARMSTQLTNPQIVERAKARGVGLFSTHDHYDTAENAPAGGEFIFGFGNISQSDIQAAIARITPLFT